MIQRMEAIKAGAVKLERKGDSLVLTHAQHKGLVVFIPLKRLETWGLQRLRENTLQPESK